jgi:hypothetical protein
LSRWTRASWLILGLAALLVAAFVLIPPSTDTFAATGPWQITILDPRLVTLLLVGCGLALGAVILHMLVSLFRGHLVWAFTCLIALPVYGFGAMLGGFNQCAGWTTHDVVQAADGQRYTFLDTSCLQGQLMAIGRADPSPSGLTRSYTVVAWTNGDSPRQWVRIVRPADQAHDTYGQLYVAPSGLLVGVRTENRMFLAFDPATGQAFQHGGLQTIDSRVLVAAGAAPHEADLDTATGILEEG